MRLLFLAMKIPRMAEGANWGPTVVVCGVALHSTLSRPHVSATAGVFVGALLLLATWRSWGRLGAVAALAAVVMDLGTGAGAHRTVQNDGAALSVAGAEARARAIAAGLRNCATQVAAIPDARAALKGDRNALDRLFLALDAARACDRAQPALAVRPSALATVAWSGRIGDLGALPGTSVSEGLLVNAGSLSTRFVAFAPIADAAGRPLGFATAELPVSVRRRIQNEFLHDFDLLAAGDSSLEIRYVDSRDADDPGLMASLQPGEALLRSTAGRPIAVANGTLVADDGRPGRLDGVRRMGAAALAAIVLLSWIVGRIDRGEGLLGTTALVVILRAVLLLIPTDPSRYGRLLASQIYSSPPGPWNSLSGLLDSPLALLWTTLAALALVVLLAFWVFARPPRPGSWTAALVADLLALLPLAAVFIAITDVTTNCALDIESISPWPKTPAHLVVQWSTLLILGAGALLLVMIFDRGGPIVPGGRGWALRVLQWGLIGLVAAKVWPREIVGLPLLPAVALYLSTALLGVTRDAWWPGWARASAGVRAGVALLVVGCLSLLLHPSLMDFAEKSTRIQIQNEYAAAVLRQPEWREHVLGQTRRQLDALELLEDTPPALAPPPLIDELAFAAWSATDLAAFGFSSAVEIQDSSGAVISRFALNLPVIGPDKPLPTDDGWREGAERLSLASAERRVLHARRLLTYHGRVHGAIHVYAGTDFWNLSFLQARDPYSVLYRTGGPARNRSIELVAFGRNRDLLFSSAEHPPVFEGALFDRVSGGPFWTTLTGPDEAQHTFVFSDRGAVYGLGYARVGPGRFAAQLVEAVTGLILSAAVGLFLVVLGRTLLGRRTLSWSSMARGVRERFALRLFVTFIAIAVLPVVVLEWVVRSFVADRLHRDAENHALERAAIARKAVEDFALFQRGEAPGRQPVTDSALVWVASLIRNDLDVFEPGGRLLASSKRELYASGLLAPRVSGAVFRSVTLEGQASALGTDRIGDFSYMVVSVPVRLSAGQPGVLSIPLALKQREVEAVLADLDHAIRLASILFVCAAAALAQSMARRISGPVRDLTEAAQRIARGELDARVSTSSRDEFLRLVDSFNRMAGDLERQRADLERSNRLAAWAEMARQVAHEVKNPLTPIQLSAEHLRRVYADASADFATTLASCTETILAQVQKLRGIVTEFSAFARPAIGASERIQVGELVAEIARAYGGVLPPGVSLTTDFGPPEMPAVRGDRRLLERAIVNLLENALQAVTDRGSVSLRVRARHDPRGVEIEVSDSGPGLSEEARARIFEPFFSTKTGGSGLGLALVRKIAEEHGGTASLEGGPGHTMALLWLPAAPDLA
jgi:signal transduction histidine kinase